MQVDNLFIVKQPTRAFLDKKVIIEVVKGENTLRVNHFCSKKVTYNKYYSMQQAKILMTSFG
jgi:hypothetical protein